MSKDENGARGRQAILDADMLVTDWWNYTCFDCQKFLQKYGGVMGRCKQFQWDIAGTAVACEFLKKK